MENKDRETLRKLIDTFHPLPSSQFELIAGECRIVHLKKNEMLTDSGQPDKYEYFLLEGIIHRFSLTEKGDFITTHFYVGPAKVMPHFARTKHGISIFSLQALTPVTVAIIDVDTLNGLKETHREIQGWSQKIVEQTLKRNFENDIRFRSSNAKERLNHLRKEIPNIENLIPHTCIASYVGITPVSFSRLRKEMTRS